MCKSLWGHRRTSGCLSLRVEINFIKDITLVKERTPQEGELGNGSRKQKRVVPVIHGIEEGERSRSHTMAGRRKLRGGEL